MESFTVAPFSYEKLFVVLFVVLLEQSPIYYFIVAVEDFQ